MKQKKVRKKKRIVNHYMTKYLENGKLYCESWLQIGTFCFSRRRIEL